MKFKNKTKGGGKVWDSDAGKSFVTFDKDGFLETDDDYTIDKLASLGYELADDEPELATPFDLDGLRAQATELGISFAPNCGAKTLSERIAKAVKRGEPL